MLWRDPSVVNLLTGTVIAVAVSGRGPDPRGAGSTHRVSVLSLARFAVFFAWKLLEANVVLAREVVTPKNVICTGIVGVALPGYSDLVVTLVANAISLTPGTLTLEVRREPEPILYVHVLHLRDLDAARADMQRMAELARSVFPVAAPRPSALESTAR